MSLMTMASGASLWRGYEYYKEGHVLSCEKTGASEVNGSVRGSGAVYEVRIDAEHPRKSSCTCPHVAGRRVICKHMIALLFAAYPEKAREYYDDVVKYEEEKERRREELDEKLRRYIDGLSKEELRQELYSLLCDCEETWIFERFVRDRLDLDW